MNISIEGNRELSVEDLLEKIKNERHTTGGTPSQDWLSFGEAAIRFSSIKRIVKRGSNELDETK